MSLLVLIPIVAQGLSLPHPPPGPPLPTSGVIQCALQDADGHKVSVDGKLGYFEVYGDGPRQQKVDFKSDGVSLLDGSYVANWGFDGAQFNNIDKTIYGGIELKFDRRDRQRAAMVAVFNKWPFRQPMFLAGFCKLDVSFQDGKSNP